MDEQPTQRQLRLMYGRSNPYQTLLALIITAVFFILFQNQILQNFQRHQMILRNSGSETHNKAKYVAHHGIHNALPPVRAVNPKFAQKFATEIGIKVNGTLLRGVKKSDRKYYLPNAKFEFVCFDGNQTIPYQAVNNDYCDCTDGSDEPGTSACPNGRFYCEPEHEYLPSSRVNDGICDCCDGSDEWKGVTISPDLKLPETKKVRLAPCSDVCHDFEHEKRLEMNLKREGSLAKKDHLKFGAGQDQEIYGEGGVYYKLSINCYLYKSPGYIYTVCPYQNVTQDGKDHWVIGRGGQLDFSAGTLTMPGGDGDHCPDEKSRSSVISFHCAPADAVKHVSEKETCVYSVKFLTPAACPDLEEWT